MDNVVVSEKNWLTTLLLSALLGFWGIHRFYANKPVSGVVWLLTCGCLGVGYIIDIITIASGTFKDGSGAVILSDNQREKICGAAPQRSSGDAMEQLKKLGELHAAGIITSEEFEAKKSILLNKII